MMDVETLRAQMRSRRRALSAEEQQAAAQAVLERLRALEAYAGARCVMAYAAARGELGLAPVIEDLLGRGCVLALPRCEAPGVMTARQVTAMDQLQTGAYGLWEPAPSCGILPPQALDLVLVPGTVFDRSGGRLGQGGGYYDRYLPQTDALRVGVCHGFALTGGVPMRPHDQRMDVIVTPQEMVICSEYRRKHR